MVGIPGNADIKPFWIGKLEVTWDQYASYQYAEERTVYSENPAEWIESKWIKYKSVGRDKWCLHEIDAISMPSAPYEPPEDKWGRGFQPVMRVSRRMAGEYCRWLAKMTGRPYRLPTEREWEYACRAGEAKVPAPLGDYAWFQDNSETKPQPAGKKKPNAWGLNDMLGNVMEYVDETVEPPKDAPWYDDDRRRGIVKGGSWADPATALTPEARTIEVFEWGSRDPQRPRGISWNIDAPHVGFRIARSE
jgi:formylglycine-generating enzyme required for sulfatase activity